MMKTTITAQGASLRAISADVVRELQNQIESATLHSSDATNFDPYFAMDNEGNRTDLIETAPNQACDFEF